MHEASATRTSGTKLAERTRADLHRAIPSPASPHLPSGREPGLRLAAERRPAWACDLGGPDHGSLVRRSSWLNPFLPRIRRPARRQGVGLQPIGLNSGCRRHGRLLGLREGLTRVDDDEGNDHEREADHPAHIHSNSGPAPNADRRNNLARAISISGAHFQLP